METRWSPWGESSLVLRLPACVLAMEGLSNQQAGAIVAGYGLFIAGPGEVLGPADICCHSHRLPAPLGLPPELFAVNGEYTPKKKRLRGQIEVTGSNSVARFERRRGRRVRALLGVALEHELATPFVLENFLRILLAYQVLDQGGALLHSAGVVHHGRAYLLAGRSNVGKTTLARKAVMAGARVLSDDINLALPEQDGYQAHKIPFTGELGRSADNTSGCGSFPLAGLALLEQAPELTATPVSAATAVAGLLAGCPFVNDDADELPTLLDVLTRLVSRTPVIRLGVSRADPYEAVMDRMVRCCEHD